MQKTHYIIGGHPFTINLAEGEFSQILPTMEPFRAEEIENALFTITIDNSIIPSWQGEKVGSFPCPSATFEVYRRENGAYQVLILQGNTPCSFIETDDVYKNITITTRGSNEQRRFGTNNALMLIYAICTAQHETLLVHSSVVENNGKAYMFLGKSGQGKSTHSDMWVKYIEGSTLINDDNPIIRIAPDGTPMVYGSPWSGKRPIYKNVQYPIGGFAAIEQEKENSIKKESIPVAFGILLSSMSTMKFDKDIHMKVCGTISKVLGKIPVHTLSCRPDEEAALVSSNAFGL
ncbi:MAG: hypothetical protein IJX41_08720 [Bacteroidaceae bacterium]|nr:hypothetical protein [Bacteroidaceae bacterium]